MVVRRKKKIRKQRGSRTHGSGCSKRGRGSGEQGGRGFAGGHKQKWSYVLKHAPNHFGKYGFVRLPRIRREVLVANVGEIDEALDKLVKIGAARYEEDKYKVNMRALGVSKVLGKGRVTHPIEISADEFSETAKRKLEGAGGRAISGEGDGGTPEAEV